MFIQIIVLVILILLNAVFATSELSFLSLNEFKLNKDVKEGNKKAIKIKKLLDNQSSFLSTIQIGITLAGFLASAFASEAFADQIVQNLTNVNISVSILKPIMVVIVTIVLSYFTLVFGELVPKRIALNSPEKVAYALVGFISILRKVAYPFVWFLTKSTNLVSKIFGIKGQKEEKLTEEEIKLIIATGKEMGAIEPNEKELIFNIFNFNDTEIEKIMTSKDDAITIDINIEDKELIKVIKKNKYTRLPVYANDKNDIIGILNIKDIIINYNKDEKFDLRQVIQKPFFVYSNEKVDDVFKLMQESRQSMCIVMKNDEEFIGIVTIEDAVEEIVGNIFDEYDNIS